MKPDYYDPKTGLEWLAGKDEDTTWDEAKQWVDSLGNDWRMPTLKELRTLYKKGLGTRNIPTELKTTGWWVWSGEIKGSSPAWTFFFFYGKFSWLFDFLNAKDYRDTMKFEINTKDYVDIIALNALIEEANELFIFYKKDDEHKYYKEDFRDMVFKLCNYKTDKVLTFTFGLVAGRIRLTCYTPPKEDWEKELV
jgi:hypothetical protein